jgi:hypothetical protein
MHTGFLWENQKERYPLERRKRRWENNIKMERREIGWGGMDWIDLVQDGDQWRALVNTAMNFSGSIKCWGILE